MVKKQKIIRGSILLVLIGIGLFAAQTRLKSRDCTNIEKYDVLTGSCYYICTSDQDCAEKASKVDAELNTFFADSQTKKSKQYNGQSAPTAPTSSDNTQLMTKAFTGTETNGTVYTVTKELTLKPAPSKSDMQAWNLFANIVGREDLAKYIQSFEVFEDQGNDTAASVWQSQTAGKWHVNVNAAYQNDKKDLIHTMVHEYGHIVSLNNTQIDGNVTGACPNLNLDEGCAKQSSYINSLHLRFWQRYGNNVPSDGGKDQNEVQDFYQQHKEDFVSEYAATNYGEDWAETWAAFITQPKPSGTQEKDKKVSSFYDFPSLVSLRDRVRVQVAANL
jgi:hypothetical protein